ncbi:MAG: M56 family metallopeptidase [Butyricicoccus pullicaecorum]|nr:M56 family metallopeptidase [Butyricicoccus pullicaecorum]
MTTIFWNLIQVSLTTSVVLLPILLLCAVLRRRYPARVVCALWVIFAVRLLVPVQNSFPDAPVQVTPRTTLVEVQTTQTGESVSETSGMEDEPVIAEPQPIIERHWVPAGTAVTAEAQKSIAFDEILAIVWAVGAAAFLAGSMLSYRRFVRRVRCTARDVRDPELLRIYESERERLGLRQRIPLRQTPEADGPMLVGLVHPVLLLPKGGIPLTDAPLILRHELTHAKHKDVLCKMVFLLARCVHWFNPVVHLLAWQGAQDLEIACDQSVVHGLDTDAKRQYGQCILNDVARRMYGGTMLTTRLTGGGKAMKTRLQALFSPNKKRRGVALILAAAFALTLVGGCFAVTPKGTENTALEQEIRTTAETYLQAIVDGDVQTLTTVLPKDAFASRTQEEMQQILLEANPRVTAYAVYPDAERAGAYVVKNWSQAPHSSLAAPDQRTVQWMQFVREDGVLKVDVVGVYDTCTMQPTDVCSVRDLDTFQMLYGDLGLPETGPAMLDDAAGQIETLLGLTGGRLEKQGETTFHYTFFNGQEISILTRPEGDGWKFDRWTAVQKDTKPVDAETQKQIEALAQRWCDAQVDGLSAEQAKTLLGKDMMAMFNEYISWYSDIDEQRLMKVYNVPILADQAEYTVNDQDSTVTVRVYSDGKDSGDTEQSRSWFNGITQVQTLYFGWQEDGLRIMDYTINQAMILDDPDVICWTADDVIKIGMPEQPMTTTSLEELIYRNFPVAGGRYRKVDDMIAYDFADGTMIYFQYEPIEDSIDYRLTGMVEPENNEPQEHLTRFVPVIEAANQWAEGYLWENAMFRYPFMSTALQQQFIQQQERMGNHLRIFWKIGWGSSPDVTDWMLRDLTEDSVTVVYQLEAGGDLYRYAERLTVGEQDGIPVVTGCDVLQATWDDSLTREQFLQLYPDDVSGLMVNPDMEYMRERSDKFQTPEDALRAAIGMFYDEKTYPVTRVGEQIVVGQGVDQDLKVTFPDGGEVYITMHQFTDEGGLKLWSVGRIWEGMPDHTT